MRERLSGREDLMKKLIPTEFGVGCRRPTVSNFKFLSGKNIAAKIQYVIAWQWFPGSSYVAQCYNLHTRDAKGYPKRLS
jgi:hypothetical protein